MSKNFEPDSQFVERLEWQLASEFRRTNRLAPRAGKVVVPRRVVALTLVVGVLMTGVAVSKAADYLKDSWRKKIEIARVETEVKMMRVHLQHAQEVASKAETRFKDGLIQEEEYRVTQRAVDKTALALERSLLNQDEVKASGVPPRDELWAPVLGGRDFVSERLEIEKKELALDLDAFKSRSKRYGQLVEKALVAGDELASLRTEIAAREGMIAEVEARLGLRKRFVAGEMTAQEVEIKDRITVAERSLQRAQSSVASLKERLDRLQALEAKGLVSKTEVQPLRFALESAQVELSLAALERDVLNKIK